MALLSVNLDHVAAIRELRRLGEPDPAQAAVLAEMAGADGIAISFRRDRKNIRERDLFILREVVKTRLTVEIPPQDEIIGKLIEVKPTMVTFVADSADSSAPSSGIDFGNAPIDFSDTTTRCKGVGIAVSFFIEPDVDAVKGAAKAGADAVLIDCDGFLHARTMDEAQRELDMIDKAAQSASNSGLAVYAGRGISCKSVPALLELGLIDEFFVGNSIISKAVLLGLDAAVKEMCHVLTTKRSQE